MFYLNLCLLFHFFVRFISFHFVLFHFFIFFSSFYFPPFLSIFFCILISISFLPIFLIYYYYYYYIYLSSFSPALRTKNPPPWIFWLQTHIFRRKIQKFKKTCPLLSSLSSSPLSSPPLHPPLSLSPSLPLKNQRYPFPYPSPLSLSPSLPLKNHQRKG